MEEIARSQSLPAGFVFDWNATTAWVKWESPYTLEDMATYFQGPVLGLLLHLRGHTPLHGSSVNIDGRAAIFVGPAGAGKSTTAAALAERGLAVISEDVSVTDAFDRGFRVRPGYPHVRLWPPSAEIVLGDNEVLEPITPNWTKLDYRLRDRFCREEVPVGAMYVLGPRLPEDSAPEVASLDRRDALLELMRNRYVRKLLQEGREGADFEYLGRLTRAVPVRRLAASADPLKIGHLCDLILDDFRTLS